MKVIEAKVEGTEPEEIEQPEEGGNLVDLMAALEASVKATKAARESEKPVSVAEAKQQRAARTTKKAAAQDEEAEAERPKRKRKTA